MTCLINSNLVNSDVLVHTEVRSDGSMNVVHIFDKPSKTDQSFKKDCDINLLVKRFTKANRMNNTQFMNYMTSITPTFSTDAYVDGSAPDYREHLQAQLEADQMFMSLPSEIRTKFDNDPQKFLNFAFDPSKRVEMATLGLLTPEATARIRDELAASSEALSPVSSGD